MSKILRRKSNFVVADPTPGGNADVYQKKDVAGKAICKAMKTKGEQLGLLRRCAAAESTPPRAFWRKSLDLLDSKRVDVFRNDKEFGRV